MANRIRRSTFTAAIFAGMLCCVSALAQDQPMVRNELSMATAANVTLDLCVTNGRITVNAWGRDELRAFSEDAAELSLKVKESNSAAKPSWVTLNSQVSPNRPKTISTDCISGGNIIIDLPAGASARIKGQESRTEIDGIQRVSVTNVGGDVIITNIKGGVAATTFRGDILVEDSSGPMTLNTTTGNIAVFAAAPQNVGDTFSAKTNSGMISLQDVDFRQVDVRTISGSIEMTGKILKNGNYDLATQNGTVKIMIPADTSADIYAAFGLGNFTSEVPLEIATENLREGPIKEIRSRIGKPDQSSIRMTTTSGRIIIKRSN